MQLTKHIGCLLALVFATASAFADATPTWFTATLAQELGARWSGSTAETYWTFANNVGKLNNWSATGNNEYLTFTADTSKSLPGDESTIVTSVKFTAMDKADFFVNDAVPAIPEGAKGGLTIVEDSDANPVTTKFYGIVNGEWVELAGDPTAALEGQVNVEVKIWENNGKHISYKVGEQQLTLNSSANLAANFSDDTIRSVSYKGVCEIASLQGDARDELWTLTLKTIADAMVEITGATVEEGAGTTTPKIKATRQNVTVTYTATGDKLFFPDVTGPGQTTISSSATVTGDDEETFVDAFKDADALDANVQVVGGDSYLSLDSAVKVAGEGATLKILKSVEDQTVFVKESMTFQAQDLMTIVIPANITVAANKTLTIDGGWYSGAFNLGTDSHVVLKCGQFAAFTKEQAEDKLPKNDGKTYFVTDIANPSDPDDPYQSRVALGVPFEPPQGSDVPAIVVDPAIYPDEATTPVQKAQWLAGKSDGGNNQSRWVNYAMGLDPDSDEKAEIVDAPATATTLPLGIDVPFNGNTGCSLVLKDADGNDIPNNALPLAKGSHVVKFCVEKDGKSEEVSTKTIDVDVVAVSEDEAKDAKIVAVPYNSINGEAVTVDNVLNKANLGNGDTISILGNSSTGYFTWELTNGSWVPDDKSPAATEATLTCGQGLWLMTATTTEKNVFQYGTAIAAKPEVAMNEAWNLLANPNGVSEPFATSKVTGAAEGDVIRVEKVGGVPTDYTYDGSAWKYTTKAIKNGRLVTETETAAVITPQGSGVWYIRTNSSKAKVQW